MHSSRLPTKQSIRPGMRAKGTSSTCTRSSAQSMSSLWDNKGHLKYRKWRELVAQAKATFLEESHSPGRSRAPVFISKVKTDSDSNDHIHEVKICVDKWKTTLLEIKERRADFKPLEAFRRIVRIVRTILKVANALKSDPKRDLGEGICKSYLEMMEGYMMMKNKTFVTSLPADTGPGLFDPNLFKANKEIQISKEVRNILNLRFEERTPDQLQTLLYACQTLSAFAELPIHMQEAICKVAWHQSLSENKIIVKQGHFAENFYFIMSGTVTVLSENDPTADGPFTSLATLRRGHSFGDTAILKRCPRTATVVSKDPVQLLVIAREDYQRIFMGRSKNGEEPSHIKFCRTLDFLTAFPVDLLIDNTANCMFHYFRRGTVIVKDSRASEWVYIVVSGMCEVLLTLEGVTPKLTGKQIDAGVSQVEMLAYLTEDRFCKSQYSYSSPSKRRTGWDEKIKESPSLCQIPNGSIIRMGSSISNKTNKRFVKSAVNDSNRRSVKSANSDANRRSVKSALSETSNRRCVKSVLSESAITTISLSSTLEDSNSQATLNTSLYPVTEFKIKKSMQPKKPVFVRIDFLHPRSAFGLSNLDFDNTGDPNKDSAPVSLVSRGAECVMISKKFFVSNAREPTKRWIRQNVLPYPSKDILQQSLQQKVNWNAYKSEILHKIKQAAL